jgi:hypothetical protein
MPDQNSFIVSFIVFPCFDEVQGHMDKLENTWSRVRCIRSMCQSFWPLILKQTVILTAMSNYFLSYIQIIGQWWLKLKWNARSKLFYCIIYRFSMLWWSSRTLTKLKSQSQKKVSIFPKNLNQVLYRILHKRQV